MNDSSKQLQQGPPAPPGWFTPSGAPASDSLETDVQAVDVSEFLDEPHDVSEFVADDWGGWIPPCPHLFWHPISGAMWLGRALLGIVTLTFLLAVIAAIPIVNFLALGYLLEVEGRVARSGRFRDAFPLLSVAPRIGTIVLGVWLWIIPLRVLSGYAADAYLIDSTGPTATMLRRYTVLLALAVVIHLCLAIARGGSFWCFFRPIKNLRDFIARLRGGQFWSEANERVGTFVAKMRPGYLFSLGLRGFAAAALWLFPPTLMFAAMSKTEGLPILTSVLGGLFLVVIFAWIPFLQAHFAAENRFRAIFELRRVRELFTHAPLAWLMAVVIVFVLALPMYLLKARLLPHDAMWLVTLVFVASIYPARVVTGWAYHRAVAKNKRAWWPWRWLSRMAMLPLLSLYVFILFFTPAISQHGKLVLFEHHAFLLPSPLTIFGL